MLDHQWNVCVCMCVRCSFLQVPYHFKLVKYLISAYWCALWWNMTYPWETNATNGIRQHVAENGGVRVAGWKVGMEPWVLPVCDLKPNLILVTWYTFGFSLMFHVISSLLSQYWPSTLTHIVCCYFCWSVSPYEIKVNTAGSVRRYYSDNISLHLVPWKFLRLILCPSLLALFKKSAGTVCLTEKSCLISTLPSLRRWYAIPLCTVTIKSLLLLIVHVKLNYIQKLLLRTSHT